MNIRLKIILETFIHEVFEYKFDHYDFIKKHKFIYYFIFCQKCQKACMMFINIKS